jgi:hexokinase
MTTAQKVLDWVSENRVLIAGGIAIGALGAAGYYYYEKTNQEADEEILRLLSFDQFGLSTIKLQQLVDIMQGEMQRGLKGEKSSLKMLTSFVGKPTGREKGVYFALDLGGTNFRVIRLSLEGNSVIGAGNKASYTISPAIMRGTSDQLFDFIADCVQEFISKELGPNHERVALGFTFSFPVNQTGVASGNLIAWTKGFTTSGVEGNDVVFLLDQAFRRKNVNAQVVVLANDTVGTMVARGYTHPNTEMGVILGTGTNACYYEEIANIPKFQGIAPKGSSGMIINMEWGAFGDEANYLPITQYDRLIDERSVNPGKQLFEKMISGMYLGEIARLVFEDLASRGKLFVGRTSLPGVFETAFISKILSDVSENLYETDKIIGTAFGIQNSTLVERKKVKEICKIVSDRAAVLTATAIGAVLRKISKPICSVAVDGSVFQFIPGFKDKMLETFKEVYPGSHVDLILTNDGSGNGAAIIAATLV